MNAELIIPGDHAATLRWAAEHFVSTCQTAIQDHGFFTVALSGGSTPKALYELLCTPPFSEEIQWDKIHLFWSDERSVPPTDPESNYGMAMKAGFEKMLIPPHHIHRMIAEDQIEHHAQKYEEKLRSVLQGRTLDLVMLGMGDDGHTASLFPDTSALNVKGSYVAPNYVPQKKTWRLTLTFDALNDAANTAFYVMGASKARMLAHVFSTTPHLPCQLVGLADHPALWIVDQAAASQLVSS
jgi:6-phosphogluconolactonase